MRLSGLLTAIALTASLSTGGAWAAVDRIDITERSVLANGASFGAAGLYEKLRGQAWFALDPALPANAPIADLKYAPRDERGLVHFNAEFVMLRPVDGARGNGTLLY